jgi:uncharacterized membrane protein YGL010W
MNDFFRRQLTAYAGYHRDERNRVTHIFGIPIIIFAIALPLSLWPLSLFGIPLNAAIVLAILAMAAWVLLDAGVGLALLAVIVPLLLVAALVASHANPMVVWLLAGCLFVAGWTLQIVGHARFEHRKPALLDNPMHLLIGPMFIVAKLLVALGFRPDLARAVTPGTRQESEASQRPRPPAPRA